MIAPRAQLVDVHAPARDAKRPDATEVTDFEAIYRANVGVLTGFFARRCSNPQTVADLTSDTFVAAIDSFDSFDPRRGTPRAWLFGIARHVFASYAAANFNGRDAARRLGGQLVLEADDIDELAAKIDAQRAGRRLLERWAGLPEKERAAIELVDLVGMSQTEAAAAMQTSPGAMRVRVFRARARLRTGAVKP